MIPNEYIEELYRALKAKKMSKQEISNLKIKLCTKYGLKDMPTDIMLYLTKPDPSIKKYLQTKPTRSISGVAPVAIMTEPHLCPHGKCAYCPGGRDSCFGDVPQSYTGKEPATMRAMRAGYDSYLQVFNRLEQYVVLGHIPEKVELIIMGGTVLGLKGDYLENFIKYALKAMNDFSEMFYTGGELDLDKFKEFFEMPGDVASEGRIKRVQEKILSNKGECNLADEQEKNETYQIRCVGMTIETRPDYGFKEHGDKMLKLGCTRVEIGVETLDDPALEKTDRGHTVADTIRSIKELRDMCFKLNFHYMPGFPYTDRDKEIEMFKRLFDDPDFRPDMMKIYPCMVLPGTKLYDEWKKGRYQPLTTDEAAELISEFKRYIPRYCRVMRIQRDIPSGKVEAGVKKTNLRQLVDAKVKEKGIKSMDIRDREIRDKEVNEVIYSVMEYEASEGREFFIEAHTKEDKLLGFCRLRFPGKMMREEITPATGLIRELHVYGPALAVGDKKVKTQHKGIGRRLLEMAEEICVKNKKDKVIIISGIGVREYYKKRGYEKEGPYMAKMLK